MNSAAPFPHRRLRPAFGLLLLLVAALGSGCLQTRSYLDAKLPRVAYTDLSAVADPRPLQLDFDWQVNGSSSKTTRKQVLPTITRILGNSKFFAAITTATNAGPDAARLQLVINNVGDIGAAVGKGFLTGLTFGAAGSAVTDGYVMTATYLKPGAGPVTRTYEHAIHSTIGNKRGPEGLQAVPLNEAWAAVSEQLLMNLLRDLQRDGQL